MRGLLAITSTALAAGLTTPVLAAAEDCIAAPTPVIALGFGSRYTDESETRSDIDEAGNAEVNAALGPIDDFIRDLTNTANDVTEGKDGQLEMAECAIAQLAAWAEADALSEMNTITANFSVGSRIAGFALAYVQLAPFSTNLEARSTIEDWLGRRAADQMTFWEEDATQGAKSGNLRAWATLGINVVGDLRDDPVALRWSAWSATFLQCEALDDGSLPQEMRRGKYALHYQLHAVAPLVLTTLLLEKQDLSIRGVCNNALDRIVEFTINDLETGAASEAYSGVPQSLFDGTDELESFQLAWLEAYLALEPNPELDAFAEAYRPFGHSKMGGDQALLWAVD
ncbi:alginate lyase family protein [Yoonia sp. BS5-3]|uniref:Alginate lyase family protein n=1 Tax=Yoonia phaeophyticola TaxID=3137369 RepID=A0ABZ2VBW0_9RHOB